MEKGYFLLLALLIIGVGNFFLSTSALIDYSHDLDYSEGFTLEDGERLLNNQSFYPEPTLENGFESVKYPPVYYIILAALSQISGMKFFTGRLLNLAATIGSLVAIYFISAHKSREKKQFIPFLFVVPYLTIFTGLTIRVDMIALAFSLTGVYIFLKDKTMLSIPFFLLAFLTKQTFVAGFIACSIYLGFKINWNYYINNLRTFKQLKLLLQNEKDFFVFNTTYFVSLILLIGILNFLYPHFIQNIFSANMGGFKVRWELLNWLHLTFLPLSGLAIYYIFLYRDKLLAVYLGISSAIMAIQLMRGGAWIYVAIQPFAISVICVSTLYRKTPSICKYIDGVLILQLLIFFSAPLISGNIFGVSEMPAANQEADSKLVNYTTKHNAYSELSGFEIATGDRISPETWSLYERYSSGKISKTEIRDFFRGKNYSALVVYKRFYKLPMNNYTEKNYRIVDKIIRKDTRMQDQHWRIYKWTG